jgi:hypothetical protein
MPIHFDQVDGVVQRDADTAPQASEATPSPTPQLDPADLAAELARAHRRQERLRAD